MTITDTYRITAVVEKQYRRGRRFIVVGHLTRMPTGLWECYTWDQFKGALCEEARKSGDAVQMTTESRWFGEEITSIELIADDATMLRLGAS